MSNGICAGCGGRLGQDCWNEQDCVWISNDQMMRGYQMQQQPEPCQGCSMVTEGTTYCLGVCSGLTSQADVEARAAAWKTMLATVASTVATDCGVVDCGEVRCDRCDERMTCLGPEPRACGTTCGDCPCSCTACLQVREELRADTFRHIEREAGR